jgi:hypothetical protein
MLPSLPIHQQRGSSLATLFYSAISNIEKDNQKSINSVIFICMKKYLLLSNVLIYAPE